MSATSTCFSPICGHTVEGTLATCPKCGGKMRSSTYARRQGWLLAILGAILVGGLGYLFVIIYPSAAHPGEQVDGTTFSGTPEQAQTMLMLFVGILAFSLGILGMGVFQIATGRRNRFLTLAVLAMSIAFMVAVRYGRQHM